MNVTQRIASIVGFVLVASTAPTVFAQDAPAAPIRLSGTYQIKNVSPSDDGTTTTFDFSATITNDGGAEFDGKVLLRDRMDADNVWARFGDYTFVVNGNVTISDTVTVPSPQFAAFSKAGNPPVFVYTQDSRGELTMFQVPLSQTN